MSGILVSAWPPDQAFRPTTGMRAQHRHVFVNMTNRLLRSTMLLPAEGLRAPTGNAWFVDFSTEQKSSNNANQTQSQVLRIRLQTAQGPFANGLSTMNELLPSFPSFLSFFAAAFVLAVIPGPGVVYIVTRTLAQGRACGLASAAGVAIGNFGNAAAASIGLAALLATSSTAFHFVKYAGAAYLCYLGILALRNETSVRRNETAPSGNWRALGEGFLVALLNPKTTLFFAAFLPQFMQPTNAPMLQALALSAIFVAVAAISDFGYVLLASAVSHALRASRGTASLGRCTAATVYFALALWAVFSSSRPGKT